MPEPQGPFVIVGAGLAGAGAAATLREEGHVGEIVLIGAERHLPYHRPPLTKEHLRAESEGPSFVYDESFYEDEAIELRSSSRVTGIDRSHAVVELDDGERLPYERLLIATGAEPRATDVDGGDLGGVHYLRTLDQSDALRDALTNGTRIVIIGAGWIGIEVAASARQLGAHVTLLEAARVPLVRILGPEVGAIIRDVHARHGVAFRDRTSVEAIEGDGVVERVLLTSGEVVEADVVLIATGVSPSVGLADQAGLTVSNGIVVDAGLRTDDPKVFAAGDVANAFHPFYGGHLRVEHWANALKQGKAAGRAMLGHDVAYDELPYFFSDQYDVGLEYWGHAPEWDEFVHRGQPDDGEFVTFWLHEGRVAAAMSVNVWDLGEPIEQLIRSRAPVDPRRLADEAVALEEIAHAVAERV